MNQYEGAIGLIVWNNSNSTPSQYGYQIASLGRTFLPESGKWINSSTFALVAQTNNQSLFTYILCNLLTLTLTHMSGPATKVAFAPLTLRSDITVISVDEILSEFHSDLTSPSDNCLTLSPQMLNPFPSYNVMFENSTLTHFLSNAAGLPTQRYP